MKLGRQSQHGLIDKLHHERIFFIQTTEMFYYKYVTLTYVVIVRTYVRFVGTKVKDSNFEIDLMERIRYICYVIGILFLN